MTVKAFLRRLIVTTSVPPIANIYRAIYGFLTEVAVWRLKQAGQVRAIYLRRGLATGQGVPGISDIDLAAIGDWDAEAQNRVTESYQRLARWCPLYDPTVGVYTPASIAELFAADPFHRHRLTEGQREWRLLFGEDCLGHLTPVSEEDAGSGYEAELKLWWSYFARWAYAQDQQRDTVFFNSLCYKVTAECLRMDLALRGQGLPGSRRQAIEEALAEASGERADFLKRLQASARRRHLRYNGDIFEDTQRFLFKLLEGCYEGLKEYPGWRAVPGVKVRIDAPQSERLLPCDLPVAAGFRVSSISAAAFAMDEVVLLFEPVSGRVPRAACLRQVVGVSLAALSRGRRRVSFYLRLPHACYQFYASDYYRGWQTILSAGFNPEIFHGCWTRPAAEFIERERQLISEALNDRVVYKANHLDFLRTFWKFLELAVIENTARRGEAVFAQTPEAVMRWLVQLNVPPAPFLEGFAAAYLQELSGEPADIGRQIPAAVEYLKNIHHAS